METYLVVNGKEIELGEFAQKILGETIIAAVTSLKGVNEGWKEFEIRIKR